MKKRVFEHENDAVLAFLKGDVTEKEMTASQIRKLNRILICDDLIRRHGSMSQVVPMLKKMVTKKYPNISYSVTTARRDYNDTQALIGSTLMHNRDYNVAILLEEMAETRQIALQHKDPKALAQCDRNKIALIEKFMGDADIPDYDSLQPQLPEIGFFPEMLQSDIPRLNSGAVDFEQLEKELKELRKVNRADEEFTEIEIVK